MDGTQYKHHLLKNRVQSSRRFNVSAFCRDVNITRTHFYDIINGTALVGEETVLRISAKLGFGEEEILNNPKNLA